MSWEAIKFWFVFFVRTWRFPSTYRRLFRDISSRYLTPQKPGVARIAAYNTTCVTSTQLMVMTIDGGQIFYVERGKLEVWIKDGEGDYERLPLWDERVRALKEVFDEMLDTGIPYQMSDTGVTYAEAN